MARSFSRTGALGAGEASCGPVIILYIFIILFIPTVRLSLHHAGVKRDVGWG